LSYECQPISKKENIYRLKTAGESLEDWSPKVTIIEIQFLNGWKGKTNNSQDDWGCPNQIKQINIVLRS